MAESFHKPQCGPCNAGDGYMSVGVSVRAATSPKSSAVGPDITEHACRLRLPPAPHRQAEGGLRTQGRFKRSLPGRPLVSIVTVSFNSAPTLGDTIRSVLSQNYDNYELIIIDGGSTDGTLELLRQFDPCIDYWVSEPDAGIYDAMNKGISAASGDYIGTLNSDDFFADDEALSWIVDALIKSDADAVHASIDIVERDDPSVLLRRYQAYQFRLWMLRIGIMPAHPTFYCRRSIYDRAGSYKTDYRVAADYEMMVRMMVRDRISLSPVPRCVVKMRHGGISNGGWRDRLKLQSEIVRACRENDYYTNLALLLLKVPIRLFQCLK